MFFAIEKHNDWQLSQGCSPDLLTIDLSDRFAMAGSDRESPSCWQNGGENDAVRACVKKSGLHPFRRFALRVPVPARIET